MDVLDQLIEKARTRQRLPDPLVCRSLRLRVPLTQGEMAEAVADELGRRVSRATVTRWESGSRAPRGPMRAAYVRVLERLAESTSDRPAGADRT